MPDDLAKTTAPPDDEPMGPHERADLCTRIGLCFQTIVTYAGDNELREFERFVRARAHQALATKQ